MAGVLNADKTNFYPGNWPSVEDAVLAQKSDVRVQKLQTNSPLIIIEKGERFATIGHVFKGYARYTIYDSNAYALYVVRDLGFSFTVKGVNNIWIIKKGVYNFYWRLRGARLVMNRIRRDKMEIIFDPKSAPLIVHYDPYSTNPFRYYQQLARNIQINTELMRAEMKSDPKEVASLILDLIPFVGSAKGVVQLITGRDLVTGKPVSRWFEAGGIILAIIPFGKAAGKSVKKTAEGMIEAGAAELKYASRSIDDLLEEASTTITKRQNETIRTLVKNNAPKEFQRYAYFAKEINSFTDMAKVTELVPVLKTYEKAVSNVLLKQLKKMPKGTTMDSFVAKLERRPANRLYDGDAIYNKIRNEFWKLVRKNKNNEKTVLESFGFKFYKEPAPYLNPNVTTMIYGRSNHVSRRRSYKITLDHKIERQTGAYGRDFFDPDNLDFMIMKTNRGKGEITTREIKAALQRGLR